MYEVNFKSLQKVVQRHVNQLHNHSTLDFNIDIGWNLSSTPNLNVELNTGTPETPNAPGNLSVSQSHYSSRTHNAQILLWYLHLLLTNLRGGIAFVFLC